MDELLMDRVNQLKAIDERLDRIEREAWETRNKLAGLHREATVLRHDIARMIQEAEAAHAAF